MLLCVRPCGLRRIARFDRCMETGAGNSHRDEGLAGHSGRRRRRLVPGPQQTTSTASRRPVESTPIFPSLGSKRKAQTPALIIACINSHPETDALEQQAIPHAAIPDGTNHFSRVNTLWESEFDLACSIEGFHLFGGQHEIQTAEIVLELRHLPRSNDRDYWHRSMAQPGECDLRHAATGLFGNRLYSRYHQRRALFPLRIEGFHSLIGHPPAVGLAFAVIFPG